MSARLSALLARPLEQDPIIQGVTADSRKVGPGFLFAALPGVRADGRAFAVSASKAGAAAVLSAEPIEGLEAPVVVASDVRRAYALAASAFWGAQPQTCVAVTGTNGKTSVAGFCRQIFARLGHKAASIGTLGCVVSQQGQADQQLTAPGLTTPDSGDLAALLARLADLGVTHLALEASSHGIIQRRLDGVRLKAAGFTNLTQDHLDYHQTMEAYQAAKLRLFEDLLAPGATAVLNADSPAYDAFAATAVLHGESVVSVGAGGQGLRLKERVPHAWGQALTIETGGEAFKVELRLVGAFQAENALVAAGLCIAAGDAPGDVLAALEHLEGAPGRLQAVGSRNGGEAYVDYAHTPDGLETVLRSLRPHVSGRLIVVFGAGGDRDAGKRPLMGRAAAQFADLAIVTDDNPRSEDPAAIRAAVLAGAPQAREIADRAQAIAAAVALLQAGDILVVAGKGHEQGQIVGGQVRPFDDVAVTREALNG
ncbi:MAG: UDP-N-acetylmuramyl-tripeptide synthetase [Caulobacteraceae bacterium]|nr:UDP-N-acetylmuramyl-tripeptide synthetase [Caulobacteraceae bacterium]